jgi:hypothetical protein
MTAPLRPAAFVSAQPAFGLPVDPRGRHRPRADRHAGLTLATIGTDPRDLGDTVRRLRERETKLTPQDAYRADQAHERLQHACIVTSVAVILLVASKTGGWF